MPPKFGTSGLRGLVTELTPELITDYTRAFLSACPTGDAVHVGWDLRPSSPQIAETVLAAVQAAGLQPVRAGVVPTPALALGSMAAGAAAIMVTGSHIPADRNGLKFYRPEGEISKQDETAIHAALGQDWPHAAATLPVTDAPETAQTYVQRYLTGFGPQALAGLRIGVYQHSSVARDIMVDAVEALGGTAIALSRSEVFVPVDTEAVDPATRQQLRDWCRGHQLDAVISTDGDADRPMLADARGQIVPGDVLGALTAEVLAANVLCTPVSSNSMITRMDGLQQIHWTRIGSPFVIAAMETALAEDPDARVVGYEANGGFLLGFTAAGPAGALPPLATRDCLLPLVAPLSLARRRGQTMQDLVASLPQRFTAADRITEVPTAASQALLAELQNSPDARATFFEGMGAEDRMDLTDGLRLWFQSGEVIHLRPSGNAPECRCYTEADTPSRATELLRTHLDRLGQRLTAG